MGLEYVDIVDENDEVVGTATWYEAVEKRLKFRAIHVLLFNDEGKVLAQFRHPKKEIRPSCWTSSAAGAIDAGENPDVAAVRETKEELGVDVELEFVGKLNQADPDVDNFIYVYVGYHNGPFDIDEVEMTEIKWFEVKEILEGDLPLDMNFHDSLALYESNKKGK